MEIEKLYQEEINALEQIQGPDDPSTINAQNKYMRQLQDVRREQENDAQRKLAAMGPASKYLRNQQKRREAKAKMQDNRHIAKQEDSTSETKIDP
jgi:hypothetical protein